MCWRGHPKIEQNKFGSCRRCHKYRMRMRRRQLPPTYRILYTLNTQEYENRRKFFGLSNLTLSVYAGIPSDTLSDWKGQRKSRQCSTTRPRAEALAEFLQTPFEKLWSVKC